MQKQQKWRLDRISKQLNKLESLIQFSKKQSLAALQLLYNCDNCSSSSSSINDDEIECSHSASRMFEETESRNTIHILNNNVSNQFYQNKSLQLSKPVLANKDYQNNYKPQFDMYNSNISSEGFKQSTIQISEIKPVDTTIKKAKLFKSSLNKNRKNPFQKASVLSNDQKGQKIGRIKSQNKLLSNISNLKRSINFLKQQKSLKKQKSSKGTQNIILAHKNYLSSKIQTLNSKRNLKYNSVTKNQRVQRQGKSKNNLHIDLQEQVSMKITDLRLKKNLCQIETSYLSASVKVTKQQIRKIDDPINKYSEQTLLKYFILKSIIKFISQYNDDTWTNSESIQIDNEEVTNTIRKPQKFIKIINMLPDILRRRNIVSEFICREFIEDKLFIEQKVNGLTGKGLQNNFTGKGLPNNLTGKSLQNNFTGKGTQKQDSKGFHKQNLYNYLCYLHLYIEFLLNNNMIHQTKRHKIFNPTSQQFFSDRSANQLKHPPTATKQGRFRESKKKDFSQRKKNEPVTLKRVNTYKALKKSAPATKPKKAQSKV